MRGSAGRLAVVLGLLVPGAGAHAQGDEPGAAVDVIAVPADAEVVVLEGAPEAGGDEVARPEIYSVLWREIELLERLLSREADDALGRVEEEILDLDVPLPDTGALVGLQMELDERFGRVAYMARALSALTQLESARDAYRDALFASRGNAVKRVAEGYALLRSVRGEEPQGLALVAIEPERLEIVPEAGVSAVVVRSLGRSVAVLSARLSQAVRQPAAGPGLRFEDEACSGEGRVLRAGDRCVMLVGWDGVGAVPEGVLVVDVALVGDPDSDPLIQSHVMPFGLAEAVREAAVDDAALAAEGERFDALRAEVTAASERGIAEVAGLREELAVVLAAQRGLEEEAAARDARVAEHSETLAVLAAELVEAREASDGALAQMGEGFEGLRAELGALRSELALLASGATGGFDSADLEAMIEVQTQIAVDSLAARVDALAAGVGSGVVGVVAPTPVGLPERTHVVSAFGRGEAATAQLEVLSAAGGPFRSGRMRVRAGDAVGEGWSVQTIAVREHRVVLSHPVLGEAVVTPRIFLPPAAEGEDDAPGAGVDDGGVPGLQDTGLPVVPGGTGLQLQEELILE